MGRDAGPTVRSVTPGDPAKDLIPIAPGSASRTKSSTPEAFWQHFYSTHEGDPAKLRETVGLLNASKKFRDVQAAITGFLAHHSREAEPWMYSGLALAIRMNKGSEADIKTALGYAADLALRNRNANDLVSVADQMLLMGQTERVGNLLDRAIEIVPHRGEPLLMSMQLATKTRDPKRMADTVDRLLSLGWPGAPGFDEGVRREARKQVEALARATREAGKSGEADDLLQRLTASEARDLFVRLTWTGSADLDLAVDDPLGTTTRNRTPRTVSGGALVQNGYGKHSEEIFTCPRAFDGTYTIHVETVYNDPEKPVATATLEVITHEGTAQESKEKHTVTLGKAPAPVTVTLKDGRRKTALPFIMPMTITLPEPKKSRAKPGAAGGAPAPAPPAPREGVAPPGR